MFLIIIEVKKLLSKYKYYCKLNKLIYINLPFLDLNLKANELLL